MNCVSCGKDNEHNRVAVERKGGKITGTVCVQCEMDIVSRLNDSTVITMATCLICGRESDILFPVWDSIFETDDSVNEFEYSVELMTPALCEGCLSAGRLSPLVETAEEVGTD